MHYKTIEDNTTHIVKHLKALSNERRLMIICALKKGESSVGDLEDVVGLSQSALSQHLARLRRDGAVSTRRDAQTIYYSLKCDRMKSVMDFLSGLDWDA